MNELVKSKGNVIARYADNEIYEVELNLKLNPYDLCELLKRDDFRSLIGHLEHLGILRKNYFPCEIRDLLEIY